MLNTVASMFFYRKFYADLHELNSSFLRSITAYTQVIRYDEYVRGKQ
jgi:hypothetical protein